MKNTFLKFYSFFFILAFFHPAFVYSAAGREGAAFLTVPVGAGPSSMGGAYTALATDAYASFYNPAGAPFLSQPQLASQHVEYLESLHNEFVSLVIPFKSKHGIGVAFEYMGSDKITRTDQNGLKSDDFSNYDGMLSLSYGFKVQDNVSLGLTGKTIRSKLDTESANAIAMDLGTLWKVSNHLTLGAAITNLGTSVKFINQSDPLPLSYKLGMAVIPHKAWTFSLEGISRRSDNLNGHFGAQYRPVPLLSLRAGYRTSTTKDVSSQAGMTMGLGLELWGQEFSYAFLPMDDLGNTNYFSFVLRFDHPETPRLSLSVEDPLAE
ncbi:MAG: PorV/PorQ family protein [Elusimicrobiota bacterium]